MFTSIQKIQNHANRILRSPEEDYSFIVDFYNLVTLSFYGKKSPTPQRAQPAAIKTL
jgi:hypothetical protein